MPIPRVLAPFVPTALHLRNALAHLARGAAELVLPGTCAACRALTVEDQPLCTVCAATVEPIFSPCPRCGAPLPHPRHRTLHVESAIEVSCLGCVARPPPFRRARAPFLFAGQLAVAVRRFKLGPEVALASPLARLFEPALARIDECDALVPVPLHPRRLRARQFNQASLLARGARRSGQPPVRELLDRVRDTPPQRSLDAETRRKNLRGAFAVAPSRRDAVRGATLCLVDDVLTTGATAHACTEALLRAGASRVDVLTLARTPL